MLDERVLAMIRDYNPQWENKEIAVPEYKRHIFGEIQKYLDKKQIIAIVGLRRVGKTVLLKQILKQHIQETGKPENCFYFLFDDLLTQNPKILEDFLDHYLKTIAKDGRKLVFFDEIQKVPYWQDVLKRHYDTRDDIKFFVSGSASLKIKKSKESLAGRIFDFYLPILTFREFLELNGLKIEKTGLDFQSLRKTFEENIHKKPLIEELFSKYLLKGAFPEIAKEEDPDIIKNYIRSSVLEKIVLEDIPAVFEVKRKDVLSEILEYCAKETSSLLDLTSLAKTVKANYQTTKSYIFYLEKSFVLDIVYNYSKSTAKQLRKNKKVHIAHPCLTITVMRYPKDVLGINEIAGRFVETTIFQHARLLSERTFIWRTPQKEEIDIILEINPNQPLPIEVKYRNNTEESDANTIIKFLKKAKATNGIIVTKNAFKQEKISEKQILFVPAWLFLLAI